MVLVPLGFLDYSFLYRSDQTCIAIPGVMERTSTIGIIFSLACIPWRNAN